MNYQTLYENLLRSLQAYRTEMEACIQADRRRSSGRNGNFYDARADVLQFALIKLDEYVSGPSLPTPETIPDRHVGYE